MIKPLRKTHRQIWLAWAFILPVAIIISWLVIPSPETIKLLQSNSEKMLPLARYSGETDDFRAVIRSNEEESKWQLTWYNKKVLAVPSAVIYLISLQESIDSLEGIIPGDAMLVGRIETKRAYNFSLSGGASIKDGWQFVLYDFIHNKVIDTIKIKR